MTYAVNAASPFYHGTRAGLKPGNLIEAGYSSNYGERKKGPGSI